MAVGTDLGLPVVDPLAGFFLAVVAPALLGLLVAVALVVVDSLAVVYPLADLGLVVGSGVVGLVDLGVVVATVDFLAPLVADCLKTCTAVATHQAAVNERIIRRRDRRGHIVHSKTTCFCEIKKAG